MAKYGGYAGYSRAMKALQGRGVAIDEPAAGYLGEGTHLVRITKIIEVGNCVDFYFEDRHGSTFRDRVPNDYASYFEALQSACDGRIPSGGETIVVVIEWPEGQYRVERTDEGYVAVIDDEVVSEAYTTLRELDAAAAEKGVVRARLAIHAFDKAH